MGADRDEIVLLEELGADAWEPAEWADLDGWRLRYNQGASRRGNSVLPVRSAGGLGLTEKLGRASAFYRERDEPVRFQMSSACVPGQLDDVLASAGFERVTGALVQTAALADVLSSTASAGTTATVANAFDAAWFDVYATAEKSGGGGIEAWRETLRRVADRSGFVTVRAGGEPASVCLVMAQGEWAGLFCMATRPDVQRRGAATAGLHAAAEWASARGARRMYLQVRDTNFGAQALYAKAGFATRYGYHYREKA
jgi:ribosomal protein S18 acetylase RimI-like enzyme